MITITRREFLSTAVTALETVVVAERFNWLLRPELKIAEAGETEPRTFPPSAYSSTGNETGYIGPDGIAKIEPFAFKDWLVKSYEQWSTYPNLATRQDYTAAMLFSRPQVDSAGQVHLPKSRQPDYWEKEGGLGFTDQSSILHGTDNILNTPERMWLKLESDGMHRCLMIVPQAEFEYAALAVTKEAYRLAYPNNTLASLETEIKNTFEEVVFGEIGYATGRYEWPGVNNLFQHYQSHPDGFVGDGSVCVAHRPKAAARNSQIPEQFRPVDYQTGLETETPKDDESFNRFDSQTSVVMAVVYNPQESLQIGGIRVEILSGGHPPDAIDRAHNYASYFNPALQTIAELFLGDLPDENHVIATDAELARWVPCGTSIPGKTSTPRSPQASRTPQETSEQDTPTPTSTLPKTEVPTPTETSTLPPSKTPRPTETPRPTVTEHPTATVQSPTDVPTMTPAPTEAGTPTQPPTPTERPTWTPIPTEPATLTPNPEPSPTVWPTPTVLLKLIESWLKI